MKSEDERAGYITLLWRLEKQVDAAHQHLRLALSLIRKEIAKQQKHDVGDHMKNSG